ncbi:hypothetical protein KE669_001965 [Salmonella enterica]|nr:hypothetical protein [Salmonella enterica]
MGLHLGKIGKVVSHGFLGHLGKSLIGAIKHPKKSLINEVHRENRQAASALNVSKFLQGIGLAPKPQPQPAPDDSTANALLSLGQQIQTQQQQQQVAQQQAQQQQIQATQAAQQAQEQARQDALRRKKMSSLLATSPTGLPDTLLGSAASLYGKSTLGA